MMNKPHELRNWKHPDNHHVERKVPLKVGINTENTEKSRK
jgi:hypothetical protein